MKGLWIGGYGEEDINGNIGFYTLARMSQNPGDDITLVDWGHLDTNDFDNVDYVVVYSYGCAAFWRMIFTLTKTGIKIPALKMLIILCGVPRFWWGQFYGLLWNVPSFVQSAICYNINSIPYSVPIRNVTTKYSNVNLDGRGLDHVTIQYDPFTQNLILSELDNLRNNLTVPNS